jgi:hypothetical protein
MAMGARIFTGLDHLIGGHERAHRRIVVVSDRVEHQEVAALGELRADPFPGVLECDRGVLVAPVLGREAGARLAPQ